MSVGIIKGLESYIYQTGKDLSLMTRASKNWSREIEERYEKTSAIFRLLGTSTVAVGALVTLIGVVSIPSLLLHPVLLLVTVSIVARGVFGVIVGLDLIRIGYNRDNPESYPFFLAVTQFPLKHIVNPYETAKEIARLTITKDTFFESLLWTPIFVQINRVEGQILPLPCFYWEF